MKGILAWFVENSVAANLIMVVILVAGLITMGTVTKEVFPEIDANIIQVTVVYLGAAPEEVEEGVCTRVEEAIQGLEGIDEITSTAAEGVGTVSVEVDENYDVRELLDDIKSRVDAIDTFPVETERPIVRELQISRQVVNVAIHGRADERTLKVLGERARDELAAIPGITRTDLVSARPYEVSIEVSEQELRRHGLSFDDVAVAVRGSSLDLPGGSLKTEGGEILLRSKGQAYTGAEFEDLVLMARTDGTYLRLGEVAHVVDGFAETDQAMRFDGDPGVMVRVFRIGNQSALDIAATVKEYVAGERARAPEGIHYTVWQDDSRILRSRMDLLIKNGISGFILVFLSLALFLRLRLAAWVTVGIPVSFLGAFWLMPTLGVTINLLSLFAFIVVLGIVVDDAIVIGESIYTEQERVGRGRRASVTGVQKVYTPVIFAVLTTVVAFMPLLFVEGSTGRIMKVIPLIVIPTLLFSLMESLLILPSHLSHLKGGEPRLTGPFGWWRRIQRAVARGLDRHTRGVYGPALSRMVEWRYLTLAVGIAILTLTIGYAAGGWIKFSFFPPVEADNVVAQLTMPLGTPAEKTILAVRRLEDAAGEVREDLRAPGDGGEDGVFRHMQASVGEQPFRSNQSRSGGNAGTIYSGAHLGEINIELAPSEERSITGSRIAGLWRDKAGPVPDAVELTFTSSIFSTGDPINVQLTSDSLEMLRSAASRLKEKLATYPGVFDVADSFRQGKQEVQLAIKPSAETLGLTLSDLARQVRQGFYGEEAQRIQRGRDDVRVMVRYPEAERRSLGDLENMRIRTGEGSEVPFGTVAEASLGRGYDTITRKNRRRAVNVTADVDLAVANANEVLADLSAEYLPELKREHPGLLYSFEGQQKQQRETLGSLMRGFAIALLVMFALLAIPLRSYMQPLIIMSAIPFGLVGAIWGHVVMGINLTMLSMFGIVALAGVVVNDSLVLVDFVNRCRADGMAAADAVRVAGTERFRAILLTSLTTFAGLSPLMLERSLQAKFLIPMAVSLAFGVIFSTVITLGLVPVLYMIVEDAKGLFGRITGKTREDPDSPGGPAMRPGDEAQATL